MFRVFILWDADLRLCSNRDFVLNKMLPEMKELINTFEPHVLWSDGDWEAYPEYFGSKDFLAWLYNQSPVKDVVVTNDDIANDADDDDRLQVEQTTSWWFCPSF